MLTLGSRPAKLGVNMATPTQKHGEERVPMKVLRLKNILLEREEIESFFADNHAWDRLYDASQKPARPFWDGKLGPLPAPGKWRESSARIVFGLKPLTVLFEGCTLSRVTLEPQVGGLTAMSLTLQCLKSNIAGDLMALDDYLDTQVHATLAFGEPGDEENENDEVEQPELDMEHAA